MLSAKPQYSVHCIERFNGRIADVLHTTRFDSSEHLTDTFKRYVQVYISISRRRHWAIFLPFRR